MGPLCVRDDNGHEPFAFNGDVAALVAQAMRMLCLHKATIAPIAQGQNGIVRIPCDRLRPLLDTEGSAEDFGSLAALLSEAEGRSLDREIRAARRAAVDAVELRCADVPASLVERVVTRLVLGGHRP